MGDNNKGSKRKKDDKPNLEEGIDDEEQVQALKAKRLKGKERVTFANQTSTRKYNFNVEAELADQEEEVDGDRIRKAPGEEDQEEEGFEPFNLRTENEEGYFDRSGNYVENKMEQGVEDAWLDEYDEKWAKKFKEGQVQATNISMEDDEKEVVHDKVALLKKVIELVNPKESVTAALKRHSGGGATSAAKKGAKNGKEPVKGRDMDKFNNLTEAADALLHSGYNSIFPIVFFSDKRERIEEELETEIANQASSSSSASGVLWEYKGQDGTLFGPYTSANMRDWRAQGYFTGDSAVQIRKVKNTDEEEDMFASAPENEGFVSSDSIDFNQFP